MNTFTKKTSRSFDDQLQYSIDLVSPIGFLIKYFLAERNLSQRELAKRIGVVPSYLTGVMKGTKANFSQSLIEKISLALNLNVEDRNELLRAQIISRNKYDIKGHPPWKWALAANFHAVLPYMTVEIAEIMQVALTMANKNHLEKISNNMLLESKM